MHIELDIDRGETLAVTVFCDGVSTHRLTFESYNPALDQSLDAEQKCITGDEIVKGLISYLQRIYPKASILPRLSLEDDS